MSNDSNKELVRRYSDEIWNQGNFENEPAFVAPNVIVHAPTPPGQTISLVDTAAMLRAALPDLMLANEHLFGDGDRVVQHWVATGSHHGTDLFGVPASSRTLTVSGINIFRIADGKISERWSIMDAAGLLQQLQAT